MANINDVAKLAGVSKSTVSHVFNNTKYTSEEVTQRVLEAAEKINYKRNYYAKTLATNKSQVIGIQLDSPTGSMNMFQQKVTNGILKVCSDQGYYLLLMPNTAKEKEYFPIDGLIQMNPTLTDLEIVDTPHIWLGRPNYFIIETSYFVDNDNEKVMERLMDLLLPNIKECVLFMNAPEDMTVSRDREQGFSKAIINNKEFDIQTLHVNYQRGLSPATFAYETLSELWKENNIDTIIVDNDFMAQGVYKFAMDNQLSIPEELSIIAVSESLESSEFFTPPLSYVDLKEEELGEKIAANLIKKINNQDISKREIVKSEIKIKGSLRE